MLPFAFFVLAALRQQPVTGPAFVRDQPAFARPTRWNGSWIVRSDRSYVISIDDGTLKPLGNDALDVVLEVAESHARHLMLGVKDDKLKLVRLEADKTAIDVPLPDFVVQHPAQCELAATESSCLLLGSSLYSCALPDAHWAETPLDRTLWNRAGVPCVPRAMAVHDARLYVAIDHGEWGGGLWSIDLKTGKQSLVENDSDPATGLATSDDGRLWATWGQAHMNARQGTLRVLEHGKWKIVVRSDGSTLERKADWPADAFLAVACNKDRVFVTTRTLGVFELADKSWSRFTIDWASDLRATGLGVDGDTVIITTYDAGVVLWNLRTAEHRFVLTSPGLGR